ncbi:unnamed protein product [Mytilus coruscus]|uniref:Uncharacterized protein n=1 Tax=Mytilus coruscus TaxID=42192 RepID=A0A6J8D4J7_MYTCO|nr:unnamed protein product [Mytilus coruscus]
MGTLLGKLENSQSLEHKEKESCCQIVKDLFAMSTKSLDQSCDFVRYKRQSTKYLPLSGEDIFGNGLNSWLEKRTEQKDQLNDLLPELGQGRKRRADFDRDWQNKNPKFNVEHNTVNARPVTISSGSPEMSQSAGFTRLYEKHKKIKPSAETSDIIFKGRFSFRQGLSLSNNAKDREVTDIARKSAFRTEFGPRFF